MLGTHDFVVVIGNCNSLMQIVIYSVSTDWVSRQVYRLENSTAPKNVFFIKMSAYFKSKTYQTRIRIFCKVEK